MRSFVKIPAKMVIEMCDATLTNIMDLRHAEDERWKKVPWYRKSLLPFLADIVGVEMERPRYWKIGTLAEMVAIDLKRAAEIVKGGPDDMVRISLDELEFLDHGRS